MMQNAESREVSGLDEGRSNRWVLIVAAVGLALAGKIGLALFTYGTNDVRYWERFLEGYRLLGGVGLYREDWLFNHPPFMIHVLRGLGWVAEGTGVWFAFWLRLPAILADVGSVWLVYKLLEGGWEKWEARGSLVLMAASPISILVSGFHGNTDPVMIFFVLLSVYLVERKGAVWLAGMALGMGMNIKVVPLIFLPAIFLYLPNWRRRVAYLAGVALVFGAGSLPYMVQDPGIVAKKVFGYGSIYGHWGLSRLTSWLPEGWKFIDAGFERYGRWGVMAAIVGLSLWMNGRAKRPGLFEQCGVIMLLFMTITPGFGVQYLAWVVPWVVGVGVWASAMVYGAGGVFLFLVYHYWSRGMWYFADSDTVRGWKGYIVGFELLAWVAVAGVLGMVWWSAVGRNRIGAMRGKESRERDGTEGGREAQKS